VRRGTGARSRRASARGAMLRLAGPRIYGDVAVEDGWMGDGRAEATAADIRPVLEADPAISPVAFVYVQLVSEAARGSRSSDVLADRDVRLGGSCSPCTSLRRSVFARFQNRPCGTDGRDKQEPRFSFALQQHDHESPRRDR
jgi:hypothetical protein